MWNLNLIGEWTEQVDLELIELSLPLEIKWSITVSEVKMIRKKLN